MITINNNDIIEVDSLDKIDFYKNLSIDNSEKIIHKMDIFNFNRIEDFFNHKVFQFIGKIISLKSQNSVGIVSKLIDIFNNKNDSEKETLFSNIMILKIINKKDSHYFNNKLSPMIKSLYSLFMNGDFEKDTNIKYDYEILIDFDYQNFIKNYNEFLKFTL